MSAALIGLLLALQLGRRTCDAQAAAVQCAFDHNNANVCCGQGGDPAPNLQDPHMCPATLPICDSYKMNHHWGWCVNAASRTPFCEACSATFVHDGTDAGGNDMDPCGPSGCKCSDENSNCVGPHVVGSVGHQSSCCALCAKTPGCLQWVISLNGADPVCWLKVRAMPTQSFVTP